MKVNCRLHSVCAAFVLVFIYMISPRLHAQGLVLSQMSPSSGSSGTIVIIAGEKFGVRQGQSSVRFGGVDAKVREWSDNVLAVEVPAAVRPGPVDVLVTITDRKEGHPGTFTVTQATATGPAKPAVAIQQHARASTTPQMSDSVHPAQAAPRDDLADASATGPQPPQDELTVVQSDATSVHESSPANTAPNSGRQTAPAGLADKQPQQGTDKAAQNQGALAAAASITDVTPASGIAGANVTITGTGFGENNNGKSAVKFGNAVASVVQGKWTNTSITVRAPDLHVAGEPTQVNISVLRS
jgi:hypothetical protein